MPKSTDATTRGPGKSPLKLTVNGAVYTVLAEPRQTLLDVLRDELALTGTKRVCDHGECGACSVLMDDQRVLACITPIRKADGKSIVTIEGLIEGDALHPVQEAFVEENAMQCGYCTSGMILAAIDLLQENANPTDQEIVDGMNRNICRCNGYPKIINAVRQAAKKMAR